MANKIQVKRGIKANLPVLSSGEPGLAIDTKELFFGTPDGNIGIATSAQLADITKDFVSVRQFGSDKNSTTIQAALDFSESVNGVNVCVPPGTYEITKMLRIPSNTKLIGLGIVIFKRMADINGILVNKANGMTGGYGANNNIHVENIIFDANNVAFASAVTSLAFGHAHNISVVNCEFKGVRTSWHDLELNGVKDSIIQNCRFNDYLGTTESLQLDIANNSGAFPWFGPYDNTACQNIKIDGCHFGTTSTGNIAIGNHTFFAGSYSKNIKITGNTIEGFLTAISLNDVQGLYVKGNRMID